MRIENIVVSNGRDGKPAYVTVTLRSKMEAEALLGEGEQDVFHNSEWLKVKPIAIGGQPNVVCCRIMEDKR